MHISPRKCFYHTNDIKDICNPLKLLGLDFFNFSIRYRDNSVSLLTTNPTFEENFFKFTSNAWYFNKDFCEYPDSSYEIWDYLRDQNSYKIDKNLFELGQSFSQYNRLTISIKNSVYSQEVYSFCTNKNTPEINTIYEQKREIFYNFIYYFKNKAKRMIDVANNNKIIIPNINYYSNAAENSNKVENRNLKDNFTKNINKFICNTKNNKFCIHYLNRKVVISKREIDCITLAAKGQTFYEIANTLKISQNTVRKHIDNIRLKLNKSKIIDIIAIFIKYRLIQIR